MFGMMKMFSCVLVLRLVAAAYVSANKTYSQVNPGITHFQAFLAALGIGPDRFNLFAVFTCRRHVYAPFPRPATGMRTWNLVSPGVELNVTVPFSFRTIRRTVSSPSPVPYPTGFVVKNCSKIWD